jgi:hypothetical protein
MINIETKTTTEVKTTESYSTFEVFASVAGVVATFVAAAGIAELIIRKTTKY